MIAATDTTQTATQFAESIAALPPLPSTAQQILTCFGDEFIDADKVTAVVEGDPGICAKLLGLSNSAYFGLAEPVNSIGEAIARVLGVDTVRSLVLAMAIQQSFNNRNCPQFDTERFWMQSLMAAECCKKIAVADPESGDAARDLAYSAGLIHNLGLMALVHMEPVRTNAILKVHAAEAEPDTLVSRFVAEFGTDHKVMTAELARIWSLPTPMLLAYQYRAFGGASCDERLGMVVAAGVAAVENTEVDPELRFDLRPWAENLGLDVDDLQGFAHLNE
ncbi:MAG: HDOD domain-containing protein, partial [Gammaproteobacteria bacterium]|nr:HDOD domain-containing protein [Gammaproteobacteria bacterium]